MWDPFPIDETERFKFKYYFDEIQVTTIKKSIIMVYQFRKNKKYTKNSYGKKQYLHNRHHDEHMNTTLNTQVLYTILAKCFWLTFDQIRTQFYANAYWTIIDKNHSRQKIERQN